MFDADVFGLRKRGALIVFCAELKCVYFFDIFFLIQHTRIRTTRLYSQKG